MAAEIFEIDGHFGYAQECLPCSQRPGLFIFRELVLHFLAVACMHVYLSK